MTARAAGDEVALDRAGRAERARIVGSLARRFGDLALAEDAVQEAFVAAAARWPIDGTPERPGAWLTTTAYRKAIGVLRRRRPTAALADLDAVAIADADDGAVRDDVSDDDLFALVLTCCHPSLSTEARVALTLRHVCGLSVGQIASAFLVPEPTMAKRLVRAREKIRVAGIRFGTPSGAALDERVEDVRTVVYLVFTEGHLATGDEPVVRAELCEEAIWLGRHLLALRQDDETAGLLALMLVQHARVASRTDAGRLVTFSEQDRAGWDVAAIEEARGVLGRTSGTAVGRYQIEATIALLHVVGEVPKWERIADLYGLLARLAPSPVVDVNRALAVGRAHGASAGLAALAPALVDQRVDGYAPLHAVHAELLELAGRDEEAASAWWRAHDALHHPAQRDVVRGRADSARRRSQE